MNNLAYRISMAVLGLGAILCAFFLKFFNFTLSWIIASKNYGYSIFEALQQLTSKGMAPSAAETADKSSELMQVLEPMYGYAVTFFVLLAIACLLALVISVLSAATNLHVPQIAMSLTAIILLVIAAACATKALNCLVPDENNNTAVKLSSILAASTGEITTDNALQTLGSAFTTVQVASLSYGFYVVMGLFIVMLVWSIISYFLYHNDNAKREPTRHKKEYRRKKPMRKLVGYGK